jgi:nucleotide-binding universal stress UspA family protein
MKRFKNILCVVEPREECKPALERAITLTENNQANLKIVTVTHRITPSIDTSDEGTIATDIQAAMLKSHAQGVETLIDPYRKRMEIKFEVLTGTPFLEIIREVLRNEHDLVIKIPQSQEWLDRLFGSDDMHLLRKCPCPVWLIKPGAPESFKRILAAVDVDLDEEDPPEELESLSALNRQILEMAYSLAISDFAELHVMHAWHAIGESAMRGSFMRMPPEKVMAYVEQVKRSRKARLNKLMREMISHLGQDATDYLKPQTHLVKGLPSKEIPALAKGIKASLVVMGTVARTGIPGFLMGNTAETILNQINCSVLAIKPPDFKTPITLEA